jgi:hypothetical protein
MAGGSNPRPPHCERGALPAELATHNQRSTVELSPIDKVLSKRKSGSGRHFANLPIDYAGQTCELMANLHFSCDILIFCLALYVGSLLTLLRIRQLPAKRKTPPKTKELIDNALEAIIDQWYLSVSDYYITTEKRAENPEITIPEELKRFHDETGHRIKFNKGDLDFTYGLSLMSGAEDCALEVSVNNKVPNFNYTELVNRLAAYYQLNEGKPIEGFKKLRKVHNCDVFHLPADLHNGIKVETREGKADIVRLSFGVQDEYLDELISDPPNFMELIHKYCVAPLRRIYAEVYRIKRK